MNLYLSRLLLDLRSRQVASEISHPYEMHRTLMRAFPSIEGEEAGARGRFGLLFRVDADERPGLAKLYVQSLVEPDWSYLGRSHYLAAGQGSTACAYKDIGAVVEGIHEGQTLAFRLRANPTKRVGRDGDLMRGKRVDLRSEEEQIAWLVAKGSGSREGVPGGFELLAVAESQKPDILQVRVRSEGNVVSRKQSLGGAHLMTHRAVVFDGHLQVTDSDAFRQTVQGGIGSAKAYGFGLLSLAPPRTLAAEKEP